MEQNTNTPFTGNKSRSQSHLVETCPNMTESQSASVSDCIKSVKWAISLLSHTAAAILILLLHTHTAGRFPQPEQDPLGPWPEFLTHGPLFWTYLCACVCWCVWQIEVSLFPAHPPWIKIQTEKKPLFGHHATHTETFLRLSVLADGK